MLQPVVKDDSGQARETSKQACSFLGAFLLNLARIGNINSEKRNRQIVQCRGVPSVRHCPIVHV